MSAVVCLSLVSTGRVGERGWVGEGLQIAMVTPSANNYIRYCRQPRLLRFKNGCIKIVSNKKFGWIKVITELFIYSLDVN